MTGPRTWLTTMAIVPAMLLSACTEETSPPTTTSTPPPTTPSSTSSTRTDPADDEVPPIRQPLDVDGVAAAPCTSLTTAQLTDLRLANNDDQLGDSCAYTDLDPATDLEVYVFYFGADNGLGELYDMRPGDLWTEWTPMELDGYPAVRFRDHKTANVCDLGVGLNETTYMRVQVIDPDVDARRDTCGMVVAVGSAVLATLKAAN